MSSGFVPTGSENKLSRNDGDWLKAQQDIEAIRTQKREQGGQEGGKSLYEVLQQNKAAKQEAFEESARLKNQFRTLDDDEAEFLQDVLESTRNKELQVKKETAEQLEVFRKQRDAAEKAFSQGDDFAKNTTADATLSTVGETWATSSRKRRRRKEKDEDATAAKLSKKTSNSIDVPLVKLSANGGMAQLSPSLDNARIASIPGEKKSTGTANTKAKIVEQPRKSVEFMPVSPPQLGLTAYGSDED